MSRFLNFASNDSLAPVNPNVPDASEVVFFTPYERTGVIIMAVAGVLSCALVSTLLLSITLSALSPWFRRSPDASNPFISKQIAVFVICLLSSDLIQSISGITQVKWAVENRLYEGPACSIQAATLVMGDLGSTVWSSVIAAHTFSGLAFGKQWSRKAVCATVIIGWSLIIILTFLGPVALANERSGPFYSLAGTWCFISTEYAVARLVIHYVPLFVASAIIPVFYGLVFLVLRGTISFTPHRAHVSAFPFSDVFSRQRITIAKRMLWYPIAYLTCILPIAITRLIGLKEENVPEPVWIFAMFFLFSLGAADSLIYATTRNLIKPLALPVDMRRFSENRSSRAVASVQKKSNSSEHWWGMDGTSPGPSSPTEKLHLAAPAGESAEIRQTVQADGVHITLERITEVI